ncbi:MAG: polyisoprenoid-binding protein [Sphingobacteriales bacterium]|nr:MAG: polyisoprenoid-binding protein [Sphingobacteriales bacterium]
MKKTLLLLSAALLSLQSIAQTTWSADPAHSSVNFTIKHMGINLVPGYFEKFDGTLMSDAKDFSDAKVDFTVQTASVNTHVEMRDNHLKTADFFDAEKYPTMHFVSTKMQKSGKGYKLHGNLTIKDVTKPVVFDVMYGGMAKDQRGNEKVGFMATTTINRLDYHINYDPTGQGVAKEVEIKIFTELAKK